jgi:hypothetical protein
MVSVETLFRDTVPFKYPKCTYLVKAVGEIAHFEQLRWEDQEKIRQRIEAGPAAGTHLYSIGTGSCWFSLLAGTKFLGLI